MRQLNIDLEEDILEIIEVHGQQTKDIANTKRTLQQVIKN